MAASQTGGCIPRGSLLSYRRGSSVHGGGSMQIGVVFPQTEIGADVGGVRAYAEAVQALGYAHVVAADHVLGADPAGHPGWSGPYTHESMIHEPFALFSFIAGVAPRLAVAPSVIILPQRQAALVAKQAAALDVLTNGRLRLGVGIGWNPVEFEALGMNFTDRARRFEEQIDLMRRLWTEPVVDLHGRWVNFGTARLDPEPIQQPHTPIVVGGYVDAAFRRSVRFAAGWYGCNRDPAGVTEMIARIDAAIAKAGRPRGRARSGGGCPARC